MLITLFFGPAPKIDILNLIKIKINYLPFCYLIHIFNFAICIKYPHLFYFLFNFHYNIYWSNIVSKPHPPPPPYPPDFRANLVLLFDPRF